MSNGTKSIVVKFHVAGGIITSDTLRAANWFKNACHNSYNKISWTVFLCYDTESHNYDVTQFHEGDWEALRKDIANNKDTLIIDLAASADIEDIMLLDVDGVCRFLEIPTCEIPSGKKGKSKMKRLFIQSGKTYHEGERAKSLIDALDKNVIINKSTIPFSKIEKFVL